MKLKNNELIRKYFNFLIDDYGFSVFREEYSPKYMGNADIVYKSGSIAILVVVDRSQVLLNVGKTTQPEKEWFEFTDVIKYFNPTISEVYDFSRGSLPDQDYVEMQAKREAQLLRQYCEPLLRGDFSMYEQIKEIENKRSSEMLEQFKKLYSNRKRT